MFCPKCGQQNEDGAKFCTKCGANLAANIPQNTDANTNINTNVAPAAPKKPMSNGKKCALIIVPIVIVLSAAIGIGVFINRVEKTRNENQNDDSGVPLVYGVYDAVNTNANNKTCSSNIKTIKSNAASYRATYNENVSSLDQIAQMFDDNALPECPLSDNGDHTDDYVIAIDPNTGAVYVYCKNCGVSGHNPDGSLDSAPTNPLS